MWEWHRVKGECKLLGSMKNIMKNRGMRMKVKRGQYRMMVASAGTDRSVLVGCEGDRETERNVFEMKYFRCMLYMTKIKLSMKNTSQRGIEMVCRVD